MKNNINLDKVYKQSENVVAREIQGELIIVPVYSGVGNLEDEIFSMNETGQAIWSSLDGRRTLKDIAVKLHMGYKGSLERIEQDIIGLVSELLKRQMIEEAKRK